jgi:hypothetical protein
MNDKNLSKFNILELTPIRLLEHELNNDGLINVLVPRFKIVFFQKLMSKKRSPYIKANLDELGSATWKLIDGKRTAIDIANLLKEKFGEKIEQIYRRVGLFLQQLYRNKFITFIEIMEK